MERVTVVAAALMLAALSLAVFAGVPAAQTSPGAYAACAPDRARIDATALPRVVEEARCPVNGRAIVDAGGLGSELPPPGTGVYADALLPDGSEEFEVANPGDGTFVLRGVGSESAASSTTGEPAFSIQAAGDGCGDSAHNPDPGNQGRRIFGTLGWRFNDGSTPAGNSPANVRDAMIAGGANVAQVQNPCGVGDGVGAQLDYLGTTDRAADINADGSCDSFGSRDKISAVGFGNLPSYWVGRECDWYLINNGQDEIVESDIRFNKFDYAWTSNLTSDCFRRYGVEAVMSHETGHRFGMDHVREDLHPYQTMSTDINGPCQASERGLGRGDALGLNEKYP